MHAYRTKEMPWDDLAVKSISNQLIQSTLGFMEVVTTLIFHIFYSSITYRLECPRKYVFWMFLSPPVEGSLLSHQNVPRTSVEITSS